LPMSRRFISPLYLRVEDIPEYARLPPADRRRIEELAAPLRATSGGLIDREPLPPGRRAAFERFCIHEGQPLDDWAAWCALAEIHGPDWRGWPQPLRSIRSAAVVAELARLRPAARFHVWLQWVADEQRAAAQAAARAAGMRI